MGKQNIKSFTGKIALATTDTQIFTSPWRIRRRYFVKKLILSNETGAATTVKFYDKDLLSATPPVRGDNANAPLLEFMVPASNTLILSDLQLPSEFFQAGMVGYSTGVNVVVMVEVEED